MPSFEQCLKTVEICQSLSNMYQEIKLFRFNELTSEIYILAGDEIEILITTHGRWRFVNEA
ncbi:DUF6888 family protein [Pseudocalidococcus azoricus]|uniref:DUF6888 family protein n=1 Tax=Pseudocalidococcus azoricus TaxID=3110322 RepID=UPI00389AFFAB